ncbi:MerR family transcriptional regulator [Piscinibacter sp.]|jgi:DNA-binding transcriptional MerR regulator|uniref:MerR family transcriptional regulator n=1 Tax=Piscinibacter sp. TaxID=1903157 RepID=UPI0035596D78
MNIREFAQHTGLSAHTLRYYERIGLIGTVTRGANGHRVYGPHDARWVEFLNRLRETGMPMCDMLRYNAMRSDGDTTIADRLELLERHTEQLAARLRLQHEHLARLREQVAVYRAQVAAKPPMRTAKR